MTAFTSVPMSRSANTRRLGALAFLALIAACAKSDAGSAKPAVSAATGDVSVTPASVGSSAELTDSTSARADRGRIRGSDTAPVWVVEISDFQCPYCKRWHDDTYAKLDKEFVQTGKVRLAYLNFPIASLHPNAHAASEAAMCASVQGKFWELHSSLFVTQGTWAKLDNPGAHFDSLAVAAAVEPAAWRACVASHATNKIIEADRERSRQSGVQSTPTFFIGDRMLLGAYPVDSFRVAINQALAKARGGR